MSVKKLIIAPDLRLAALRYAQEGLKVLPCKPDKTPYIDDWRHRATSDARVINTWWSRWPVANIGLLTGQDGYDVLDVDVRQDGNGLDLLERLQDRGLATRWSRKIATPSGGVHLYFKGTGQHGSKITGGFIDFKAEGGYVIAPPSVVHTATYSGRYIELERRPAEPDHLDWRQVQLATKPAAAPWRGRWRSRSTPSAGYPNSVRAFERQLRSTAPGERNTTLFQLANRMAERGRDPRQLTEAALAVGLSQREINQIIASALRASAGRTGRRGR